MRPGIHAFFSRKMARTLQDRGVSVLFKVPRQQLDARPAGPVALLSQARSRLSVRRAVDHDGQRSAVRAARSSVRTYQTPAHAARDAGLSGSYAVIGPAQAPHATSGRASTPRPPSASTTGAPSSSGGSRTYLQLLRPARPPWTTPAATPRRGASRSWPTRGPLTPRQNFRSGSWRTAQPERFTPPAVPAPRQDRERDARKHPCLQQPSRRPPVRLGPPLRPPNPPAISRRHLPGAPSARPAPNPRQNRPQCRIRVEANPSSAAPHWEYPHGLEDPER